jgi:hypothetical protein
MTVKQSVAHLCASMVMLSMPMLGSGYSANADDLSSARIEVVDARFRILLPDGQSLAGRDLIGVVLHLRNAQDQPLEIRIDLVVPRDAEAESGIELYGLSRKTGTGVWAPLCKPGADGRALAFPLPGASTADEDTPAAGGEFSITCTAGARGKCAMLGYRPWATADDGASLDAYFAACVRMMRADYCGDGRSYTRAGVKVDMWDRAGVQAPQTDLPFEAAWGPDGAVCLRRARVPAVATTADVLRSCPRLAAHGDDCEAWSQDPANGALLWNRSAAEN